MIDTHLHLFEPERFSYPWTQDYPALQDRVDWQSYQAAAQGLGIQGALFMEVDVAESQSGEEIQFFCDLAQDESTGIVGVIGSARPEHEGLEHYLDQIAHPALKGIRRVLHTQPDALSQSSRFRENIARIGKRGLTFDICMLQRQLPLAFDLAAACPETVFILDHCGVPSIADNDAPHGEGWIFWRDNIQQLAELPNLNCKISGIPIYAGNPSNLEQALRPYVETVIEHFGWDRVLWGSDFPVCNLGSTLNTWHKTLKSILAHETDVHREKLFVLNAQRIYKINL